MSNINKEYISISEYSNKVNLSRQAIYKQLNGKLSDFVVIIDGKKYLKRSILNENQNVNSDNQVDNSVNQIDNQVDNSVNQTVNFYNKVDKSVNQTDNQIENSVNQSDNQIDTKYLNLIEDLLEQIKEKDKQIKSQNEQIVELSNKIADLFENNQKLQLNYQLLLSDGKENNIINVNPEDNTIETNITDDKLIKKGFFRRLFNI